MAVKTRSLQITEEDFVSKPRAVNLDKLFEGSLRRLQTEAEYFSRLTDHDPEHGRLNESHLVNLLRAYLPPKIGIGTGFIACGGRFARQSPQCDIILYDALNNAPMYRSDTWSIYPIEIVYGVIEVKTKLNRRTLKDAFVKCAQIRSMAQPAEDSPNKAYLISADPKPGSPARYHVYYDKLAPRFFVFSYGGWKSALTLEEVFKECSAVHGNAHIHGICCLSEAGGMLVGHKAFQQGERRFSTLPSNGFRFFLMSLPKTLNSMLPPHRLGLGFDLVHIDHYLATGQ
jgi:uncharacterized protein DUF6602